MSFHKYFLNTMEGIENHNNLHKRSNGRHIKQPPHSQNYRNSKAFKIGLCGNINPHVENKIKPSQHSSFKGRSSNSVCIKERTDDTIGLNAMSQIFLITQIQSYFIEGKTVHQLLWSVVREIPEPIYLTAMPYKDTFVYFTQCGPTWSKETDTVFMIVKMVFFYMIPLLFMSIAYIQIIRVLWKSGKMPHHLMGEL
ncbi:hypothetical protein JTB14_030269 [Gonioctena quinquepunctata]|nr:hypothetical protein JTB14_030269 [Gonioctena quinquepunctata]